MTDAPWLDPAATGYGRRIDEAEYVGFVHGVVEGLRNHSESILGADSPHIQAILDFADKHVASVQRDWLGGSSTAEIWSVVTEHDRMDRNVVIRVTKASWLGEAWRFDVRAIATWIGQFREPNASHPPVWRSATENRWFGLSTLTPPQIFTDTLEIALLDAKSCSVNDLIPIEEWRARERPIS